MSHFAPSNLRPCPGRKKHYFFGLFTTVVKHKVNDMLVSCSQWRKITKQSEKFSLSHFAQQHKWIHVCSLCKHFFFLRICQKERYSLGSDDV